MAVIVAVACNEATTHPLADTTSPPSDTTKPPADTAKPPVDSQPNASYYITPDTNVLSLGMTRTLRTETFSPQTDAVPVTGATWSTSNPSVASIDGAGRIVANGLGHTTITATRDSTHSAAEVYVIASNPVTFSQLGHSFDGNCGLTADGHMYCWGNFPQSSDSTRLMDHCEDIAAGGGPVLQRLTRRCAATPVLVSSLTFTRLITGDGDPLSLLAIGTDGFLYAIYGASGAGTTAIIRTAYSDVADVTTSTIHECTVSTDHTAHCWGFNQAGELGIGSAQALGPFPSTPQLVLGSAKWSSITARDYGTCALTTDAQAYCWGDNRDFRLGIGPDSSRLSGCFGPCVPQPTPVLTDARFIALSTTQVGTCGITAAGTAYCWGPIGSQEPHAEGGVPIVVAAPAFTKLLTMSSPCGLTAGGDLYCLRRNGAAADAASLFSFQKIAVPFPVATLAGSDFTTCAISSSDGKAYCWGSGRVGRLGDGNFVDATIDHPVLVAGQGQP
jgi:hypothetical protein